ncbi:MAG: PQQ-binding-like beta-propeller repeat protein [Planctomycetes bacterium]|nr:PQQ-binding-like beta-propeller repeat protein [Planctomycetota bacterium]
MQSAQIHADSRESHLKRARPAAVSLIGLLILVAALSLISYLTVQLWQTRKVRLVIQQAVTLLNQNPTPDVVERRLAAWERQTKRHWYGGQDALVDRLLDPVLLADRRVRTLLTYLTGCDYGEQIEEWELWRSTRARLRDGLQPDLPRRRAVKLEKMWQAPIGLTAWFSNIVPIDGQIYVASLGLGVNKRDDRADGVVRVDGRTGRATLIFRPTEGSNRDVMGICAGTNGMFVASRNGRVYFIDPDGGLKWSSSAGSAICAPPMSLDFNRDGILDVIVVTQRDKVVAFNGRQGKTVWVSRLPTSGRGRGSEGYSRPGLAAWRSPNSDRTEVVATTSGGRVVRLDARHGKTIATQEFSHGFGSGAVLCDPQRYERFECLTIGRSGQIASTHDKRSREASWALNAAGAANVVTLLRTISAAPPNRPLPLTIATIGGAARAAGNMVCGIDADGIRWRFAPGGHLWATPAIADMNGDRRSDIVIASTVRGSDGEAMSIISILSAEGQCIYRLPIGAPVGCSPVVADVDGDDKLELLIADQSGLLHCFKTNSSGPVEWGVYGGDAQNTQNAENAYSWGQVPYGFQKRWRSGF